MAKEVMAAGIGCAIADSLFNPLEIVKVRLQVNGGNGSVISASRIKDEIFAIIRTEGISDLWTPGLLPTFLRGLLYAGSRIGMYPTVRNLIDDNVTSTATKVNDVTKRDSHFMTKLLAGAICGAVGSFIFSPLDLIRINFQRNPKAYPSTRLAFYQIYKNDGFRGLWSGSSATVLRATLLSGCQLSIYDQIKNFASTVDGGAEHRGIGSWLDEGPILHASASILSGVIAQAIIMPVDTLKTKMMVKGREIAFDPNKICVSSAIGNPSALSLLSASSMILREGGIAGFYRGFAPALLRQGPCILLQVLHCTAWRYTARTLPYVVMLSSTFSMVSDCTALHCVRVSKSDFAMLLSYVV